MSAPGNPVTLAHWRRTIAELYAAVRAGQHDPGGTARDFRAARDRLFAGHPDSPIPPARRAAWRGADWFDYDPAWRMTGTFEASDDAQPALAIPLADDGTLRCRRVGVVRFAAGDVPARLAVYWLEGYGGGLWLPFGDAGNGAVTYGGGRYLYDTIKGADLGARADAFVLDFNFAYNPSCAYDDRWSCPLSPAESRLPFVVAAGERRAPG